MRFPITIFLNLSLKRCWFSERQAVSSVTISSAFSHTAWISSGCGSASGPKYSSAGHADDEANEATTWSSINIPKHKLPLSLCPSYNWSMSRSIFKSLALSLHRRHVLNSRPHSEKKSNLVCHFLHLLQNLKLSVINILGLIPLSPLSAPRSEKLYTYHFYKSGHYEK